MHFFKSNLLAQEDTSWEQKEDLQAANLQSSAKHREGAADLWYFKGDKENIPILARRYHAAVRDRVVKNGAKDP